MKRLVRKITSQPGTLTRHDKATISVNFSLNEWQEISAGNIAGIRSGGGTLRFDNMAAAFSFYSDPGSCVLRGGGIEAEIIVVSPDTFKIAGPIREV